MFIGSGDKLRIRLLYISIALLLLFIWYSMRRRPTVNANIEVRLPETHLTVEYHSCSVDSCLKLDRCLYDMDRIRVYVQPIVKFRHPDGRELEMAESVEFNQIRQTIMNSEYAVDVPEKACLIVPGVDLLNLRKFKSSNEVQQIVEAISTLLPANSNLLLFNFVGLREPIHLKAIWASASLDQYTLRRKFDVSLPMLRPYSLMNVEQKDGIIPDLAMKTPQNWAIVLRFASTTVVNKVREILDKSTDINATLIYLTEIKGETEKDVRVVKDQHNDRRDYVDVLRHSTFTLIHDLVPGFQMLLLDALECGSIPVLITDDYLPPFHELLDWPQLSILVAKQNLPELANILQSIRVDQLEQMRLQGQRIYHRLLESSSKIALDTLRLIERRVLPVESDGFGEVEDSSSIDGNKRLWLDVPIRSMASNFTIILAPPYNPHLFEQSLEVLWKSTHSHLKSILVFSPLLDADKEIVKASAIRLQTIHGRSIHFIDWDPARKDFGQLVDLLIGRVDTSKDCWMFVDLRSTNAEKRSKLTKDLIDQAFAAWKENADSILSFDPYSVSQIENSKSDEERKQAPFYRGVAFIHPHAAQDIAKSSTKGAEWARCSKVSSQSTDCTSINRDKKCPQVSMEFCRPAFIY